MEIHGSLFMTQIKPRLVVIFAWEWLIKMVFEQTGKLKVYFLGITSRKFD